MERLFSGCPILESLTIMRAIDFLQIMNISIPSLKTLVIGGLGIRHSHTEINTPCLKPLTVVDYATTSFSVNFTSSLCCAGLCNAFNVSLLNGVSQVFGLTLKGYSESLHSALPTFKNLLVMDLLLREPVSWKLLPNLLESTPNLRELVFSQGLVNPTADGAFNRFEWQRPETEPKCLSTHDKTIEIYEFVGFPEELQLVEYMLECCKVLEKMIIHNRCYYIRRPGILEKKDEEGGVMNQILRLKRNSTTCQLLFT